MYARLVQFFFFAGLLACLPPASDLLPLIPPVPLSGAWTSVELPETPLGLASHGRTLWVSGGNEMIANSDDGGRHWTMRHLLQPGEMLFAFTFPAPQTVLAFGSAGVWLESHDAGLTWERHTNGPQFGITTAKFPDARNGYVIGQEQFAMTHDGGKSWRTRDYSAILGVAAPDAQHVALLLSGKVAQSSDGGGHWQTLHCPSVSACAEMRGTSDGYIVYGDLKPPSKPEGGEVWKTPGAWTSSFGDRLQPGTAPTTRYLACFETGCLLQNGWEDLSGSHPRAWQLPDDPDQPLTGAWATQEKTFCRVSSQLRCREGQGPWVSPPPEPAIDAPRPVTTPDPEYPDQERANHRTGVALVRFRIGSDGRVHQAILIAADSVAFAQNGLDALSRWRFHPATQAGQPIPATADAQFNFRLLF